MGPADAFADAQIVFLTNRNDMDASKGTNQNEAEGGTFAALVDGALEIPAWVTREQSYGRSVL